MRCSAQQDVEMWIMVCDIFLDTCPVYSSQSYTATWSMVQWTMCDLLIDGELGRRLDTLIPNTFCLHSTTHNIRRKFISAPGNN